MDVKKKQTIIDDIKSRNLPLSQEEKRQLGDIIATLYLKVFHQKTYEQLVAEQAKDFYVKLINEHINNVVDIEHQDPDVEQGWEYFPYDMPDSNITEYGERHRAFMEREGLYIWDFVKFTYTYMQQHDKSLTTTNRGEVELWITPLDDPYIAPLWRELNYEHKVEVINEHGYYDDSVYSISELESDGFPIYLDMSYWTLNIIPDVEAIFDELDRIFKEKQKEAK